MATFQNPVLAGFSPDPSVCRVGEDYYLVTSTFAYFPGVPIYHSKDLVNWQQIGNVLERKEQLNLEQSSHSQGIFAPCLRYHDGLFYLITTNVTHGGNFFVTASNPKGPWSEPYFLDNAPGIDPSLFFDDDGHCYYVGTRPRPKGVRYNGDWEVWVQELDLKTKQLIGVSTKIWQGALREVIWPEGPHLYKKDLFYYLMIAEGGTGFNHCVTIARSKQIDGPYEGNKNNPILTHRHLGKVYPVRNVGHGDLVSTPDGQWYMTCLASRDFNGYSNLGRETFLAKVEWEDGWPVVNPGEGRLLETQEHDLPLVPVEKRTHFTFEKLLPEFLFLRNPYEENYQFTPEGKLKLFATKATIGQLVSPSYLGLRQQSMNYCCQVHLNLAGQTAGEAGLVILQSDTYSLRLTVTPKENKQLVRLITRIQGVEQVIGEVSLAEQELTLKLIGAGQLVKALVESSSQRLVVAENVDVHYLSTEVAGGFVGCTLGVYTTSPHDRDYVEVSYLDLE